MRQIGIALLLIILTASCGVFETRNPEEPDTGKTLLNPPTSPAAVIGNFQTAVKELNTENYLACFSDSVSGSSQYIFEPSQNAKARFPSLFENWNKESERRAFTALKNSVGISSQVLMTLTNYTLMSSSPDSSVYTADYTLEADHTQSNTSKVFSGTMLITISPETSGLWTITRWRDYSLKNIPDSLNYTWSYLKAAFSN